MTRKAKATDPAATMTPRQAERRSRVITAVIELATEGGYDAVQIREVAQRAEVALGTVYRYFVSKDHLLAEAMLESTQSLAAEIEKRPPSGNTPCDKVLDIIDRAIGGLTTVPNLGMAFVTGLNSPGPEVAEAQEAMHKVMSGILALGFPPDFDPDLQRRIVRTTEHVWGSTMTGWMIGWMTIEQAKAEVSDAVRLLFV